MVWWVVGELGIHRTGYLSGMVGRGGGGTWDDPRYPGHRVS